ncbi:MAG TPA: penicillin-binding transpeptidase domain-containing protein [Tepidisphaeraceae bacterium]|jgi:penicillin-binding protein 2
MFERRLKIFLAILLALGALVAGRAAQVQLLEHRDWQIEAASSVVPPEYLQTTRGRILDCRGRVIAEDAPCSDVCVDYPAILGRFESKYDQKWLRQQAVNQLHRELGGDAKPNSVQINTEIAKVHSEISAMWPALARAAEVSPEEIDQSRRDIIQEVEMRQRYLWHLNYELANQKPVDQDASWLSRFLNNQTGEPIDQFDMVIAAQTEPHAILHNATSATCTLLAKNADQFPGLTIRKATMRYYPYGDVAAHVIGRLSHVNKEDLKARGTLEENDLRRYWLNDDIGRTGLEALAEDQLRGTRGKIIAASGDQAQKIIPAIPGRDVTATMDMELEKQIQDLFKHVELTSAPGEPRFATTADMNGAAVIIDIATGQVRAMVSNPSYDLNRFDEEYAALSNDQLRQPYLNRATQVALEPGSTVKPMVGIGAITAGVDSISEAIPCDGYLTLRGHKYMNIGRCWIAKLHMPQHRIGPTLRFEDAIEQSCNVYFETMADRLGMERLAHFYSLFGLGRLTGVGLDEVTGRIPSVAATPQASLEATTWFCGIGQTQVLATPIQMCNVATTVARDGIWMRPRLIADANDGANDSAIDLNLSKAALVAARAGMVRVVNAPYGTGRDAHMDDLLIAGKTGTAQAARFTFPRRDPAGAIVRDEKGNVQFDTIEPSTYLHVNPQAPWYWAWGPEAKDFSHAWFMGFAPANHPKLAIAVMVEYGGHGGATAGRLAAKILQACVDDGYLPSTSLTEGQ